MAAVHVVASHIDGPSVVSPLSSGSRGEAFPELSGRFSRGVCGVDSYTIVSVPSLMPRLHVGCCGTGH